MADPLNILHLDDDLTILDRFATLVQKNGTIAGREPIVKSVDQVSNFQSHLKKQLPADIVLVDVHLAGETLTGVELAQLARASLPYAVILVVSSSKDSSVIRAALRAGADDFVSKDVSAAELATRIEASLESKTQQKLADHDSAEGLSFAGATIAAISRRVPNLVKSAVNCIYVEGESGSGKEVVADLVAEAIGKATPFIRVNCGAIAPTLLASELFGHVKGAFTGAQADKSGLLEAASGGWIFLDEVASLPTDAQVALLRAIDNQMIRRVGATTEKPIKFRVISATNEPLDQLVESGKFRKDLWQRLRETHITLPPLRDRKTEIPHLIEHFLSSMRGGPYELAPTVQETLVAYDWSEGNVRELRNVLRAMTEKSVGGLLTPKSIPERIWDALEKSPAPTTVGETARVKPVPPSAARQITLEWQGKRPDYDTLSQLLLVEILRLEYREHGTLSLRGLSKTLGMAKSTVSSRIRSLVDERVISSDELGRMLKMGALKDEE